MHFHRRFIVGSTLDVSGSYQATLMFYRGMNMGVMSVVADRLLAPDSLELDSLLQVDDQCDGAVAAAGAQKVVGSTLSRNMPIVMLGSYCSGSTIGAAPIYAAASPPIPMLASQATNVDLSNRVAYPYFLRNCLSDDFQAAAMLSFIKSFGWTRVACIYTQTVYGAGGCQSLRSAAATMAAATPLTIIRKAVQVLGMVPFNASMSVAQVQSLTLAQLQKLSAPVVVVFATGTGALQLLVDAIRAAGMFGNNQIYIFSDTFDTTVVSSSSTIALKAARADTLRGSFYVNLASGSLTFQQQTFADSFIAQYPFDPPGSLGQSALAFDAMYVVAQALRTCIDSGATPVGAFLYSCMRATTFWGATGLNSFSNSSNDRQYMAYEVYNNIGSKQQLVATSETITTGYYTSTPSVMLISPLLSQPLVFPNVSGYTSFGNQLRAAAVTAAFVANPSVVSLTGVAIMWPGNSRIVPTLRQFIIGAMFSSPRTNSRLCVTSIEMAVQVRWVVCCVDVGISFVVGCLILSFLFCPSFLCFNCVFTYVPCPDRLSIKWAFSLVATC
jgi:ABC-type branched-subunit amino acid transport system substrate-binding protein